ncbi:RnfABCDGE type electron transport complex subunit B [Comamonas sp. NLF-1-9]|uniref:RnfABCDGE type electron transport complex subunit B n=1 Tax=Comamonas sp. NLF-1-9 TaxID=2853163 RepID=UPI001C48FDFE|nr:RnfABCDGE type electron transport complex subunit B [Comamonas sp. NLF-1-9]QXL85356.1 RnfABCDGE type electron transport complex subunit B [Comamonas sp. NLF-1-9]
MSGQPQDPQTAQLAERINAALPQTQCTRCGFADCAAYAHAIASGEAAINQCPPGGAEGVARLAAITGQSALALNPEHGLEKPRALAVIDEDWCIGCTRCMKVCPTDAIVGIHKRMHTILDEHCTGCELCVDACPVDCISMEEVTGEATGWDAWSPELQEQARSRYSARQARLRAASELSYVARTPTRTTPADAETRQATIEAIVAQARHTD